MILQKKQDDKTYIVSSESKIVVLEQFGRMYLGVDKDSGLEHECLLVEIKEPQRQLLVDLLAKGKAAK